MLAFSLTLDDNNQIDMTLKRLGTKLIQLKVGGTKLKYGIKDKDQLCNLPTNLLWSTNKANQINYEN